MLSKTFGSMDIIKRSLDASWLRNKAISENIANVNTPNYKRKIVKFEDELAQMLKLSGGVKMKMTNEKHIPLIDIKNLRPNVHMITETEFRSDRNNVNIDIEMSELARNQIWYKAMSDELTSQIKRLSAAIKKVR